MQHGIGAHAFRSSVQCRIAVVYVVGKARRGEQAAEAAPGRLPPRVPGSGDWR